LVPKVKILSGLG